MNRRIDWLATIFALAAAVSLWGSAPSAWGQPLRSTQDAIDQLESITGQTFQGLPTDWSDHYVVFSAPNPSSPNYDAIQNEPRYLMQVIRRNLARESAEDAALSQGLPAKVRQPVAVQKDWTMFTGGPFINPPSTVINMFPAKYSFSTTTQSCSDFVVYSTEQSPGASQASIVGFNNLYAGTGSLACGVAGGGTVPTVSWAYNTSAVSTTPVTTSPVLSLDGTQLAFVQGAQLIILKLAPGSGTLTAPISPTRVSPASYRSCTAPCMTSFTLNNTDARSAPYVDYAHDTLYIGDSGNILYQFTGVFMGTPTKTGAPWPVTVAGAAGGLSAPAYDPTSTLVFVSDITGGSLFSVTSNSTGTITQVKSGQLSFNGLLNDAPLVDPQAEELYYFSSDNAATSGQSAVFQLSAPFTAGSKGSSVLLGAGFTGGNAQDPGTMFAGAFDNAYLTSTNGASPTGHLYTCGNLGGTGGGNPPGFVTLYQIPISANAMQTPNVGPQLDSANGVYCSPITEFDNGTVANPVDLIFLSVTNHGTATTGWNYNNQGCLMSFNVTGGIISSSTTPASSTNEGGAGGTTAVVVDNNITTADDGGAQIYLLPLNNLNCTGNAGGTGGELDGQGTGVCAVQASQNNLAE